MEKERLALYQDIFLTQSGNTYEVNLRKTRCLPKSPNFGFNVEFKLLFGKQLYQNKTDVLVQMKNVGSL